MRSASPGQIELAYNAYKAAPHGAKKETMREWAPRLGVTSDRQVRRKFEDAGLLMRKQKEQRRKSEKYPDRRPWAEVVAWYKYCSPGKHEKRSLKTMRAVRHALQDDKLQPEAAEVPRATWDRWIRDFDLKKRAKRITRIRAKDPNKAWWVDGSFSEYFSVVRELDDGDYLLAWKQSHEGAYKNKPKKEPGRRVLYIAAVDDHSGCLTTKAYVASGESAERVLHFLNDAMCGIDRAHQPYGRPANIVMDNGPARNSLKADDAFMRMGIALPGREPWNKRAGGKIERRFRVLWQDHELEFAPRATIMKQRGEKFMIRLSELNACLNTFIAEYNQRPHLVTPEVTRLQAWLKIMHGGLCEVERGDIFKGYVKKEQRLDGAGMFRFGGKRWAVKQLYDVTGHLFQNVKGQLAFVYRGIGYNVVPAEDVEKDFGEYRGEEKANFEKIETPDFGEKLPSIPNLPGGELAEVVAMPARNATKHTVKEPFSAPHEYPSVDVALDALRAKIGAIRWRKMSPDHLSTIRGLLETDLKHSYVEHIADVLREKLQEDMING